MQDGTARAMVSAAHTSNIAVHHQMRASCASAGMAQMPATKRNSFIDRISMAAFNRDRLRC
eukprot:3914174-Alexandrium_andersonii.AAC.1